MQTSDDFVEKAAVFAAGAVIQTLLFLRCLHLGIGHRRLMVARILPWLRSWTVKSIVGPVSDVKCAEERVIAHRLREARLRMGRIYLHTITVALFFTLVSIQTNIVLDRPRWMSAVTVWTVIGSTGLVALPCLLPRIVNARTLDGFLVVLQGSMTVIASPLGSSLRQGVFVSLACLALVRTPAACFSTHTALPIACCLAHSGMMMLRGMMEVSSADDDGRGKVMAYAAIWGELLSFITMVGAAFLVQVSLKTTVRRGLQHGDAAAELCAATSLLRLTCDAVLELDEDLCLTDDCPELSAILLRDQAGTKLKGRKFVDFVASKQEALRAMELLKAEDAGVSSVAGVSARAFHTRLADSCSSKFRVEVFQVRYQKQDGEMRHLLGLRDFTDQQALAGRNAADATEGGLDSYKLMDSTPVNSATCSIPAAPANRIVYLQLDMEQGIVEATSVFARILAGMRLTDVFPGFGSVLMQNVWAELVQSAHMNSLEALATKLHTFERLQVNWGESQTDQIDGVVEPISSDRGYRLLVRCSGSSMRCPGSPNVGCAPDPVADPDSHPFSRKSSYQVSGGSDNGNQLLSVLPGRIG